VRADGVDFDREECERGTACVAAPVLSAAVDWIGAVSITGPTGTLPVDGLAASVRCAAAAIARTVRVRLGLMEGS